MKKLMKSKMKKSRSIVQALEASYGGGWVLVKDNLWRSDDGRQASLISRGKSNQYLRVKNYG